MLIRLETQRITIRNLVREDWAECQRLQREVGSFDSALNPEQVATTGARWFEWTIQSYDQLALLRQPPYGERAIIALMLLYPTLRASELVGTEEKLEAFIELMKFLVAGVVIAFMLRRKPAAV